MAQCGARSRKIDTVERNSPLVSRFRDVEGFDSKDDGQDESRYVIRL
jgi:hypothetical protein